MPRPPKISVSPAVPRGRKRPALHSLRKPTATQNFAFGISGSLKAPKPLFPDFSVFHHLSPLLKRIFSEISARRGSPRHARCKKCSQNALLPRSVLTTPRTRRCVAAPGELSVRGPSVRLRAPRQPALRAGGVTPMRFFYRSRAPHNGARRRKSPAPAFTPRRPGCFACKGKPTGRGWRGTARPGVYCSHSARPS